MRVAGRLMEGSYYNARIVNHYSQCYNHVVCYALVYVQNSDQGVLPIYLPKLMHVRELGKSRICFAVGGIVASVMEVDQLMVLRV